MDEVNIYEYDPRKMQLVVHITDNGVETICKVRLTDPRKIMLKTHSNQFPQETCKECWK